MKNKNIQPILENLQFQRRKSFNIPLYASATKGMEFPAIAFSLNSDYNSPILVENTEDVGLTGGELVRTSFNILSEWLPKSPDFEKTLTTFLERLKRQSNLTDAAYLLKKDIAITFAHLSDVNMDVQQPKRGLTIVYH